MKVTDWVTLFLAATQYPLLKQLIPRMLTQLAYNQLLFQSNEFVLNRWQRLLISVYKC